MMSVALGSPEETSRANDFAIHLHYLTGRVVATRSDDRERAEWPPHPGRLYMALAAAYFETDDTGDVKCAQRAALDWLASQAPPAMYHAPASERTVLTHFVPVNDSVKQNKAMLQSAPGMPRSRQGRTFPTAIPMRLPTAEALVADVSFYWRDLDDAWETHLPALRQLCDHLIRVGHSSSLVLAWAESGDLPVRDGELHPTGGIAEIACRVAVEGEVERLREACGAEKIERFAQLKLAIDTGRGKVKAKAREAFQAEFGETYKMSLRPPAPQRATLGIWQGYHRAAGASIDDTICIGTYFDDQLLILAKHEGPVLDVERTLGVVSAFRRTALSRIGDDIAPAWLTGHDADGRPTAEPHAAFIALPFVGHPHADGHIMGLGLVLPRGVPAAERGRWLGPLLVDENSGDLTPCNIALWGRDLPNWTVQLEDRLSPPTTLQGATWTAASTTWASVTPVVLDRFPKGSRGGPGERWERDVKAIVSRACSRAGLPEPEAVEVAAIAWHTGVPRAYPGPKTRGRPTGEGFPALPAKSSRPVRPQVHVRLRFAQPVQGPVLLGAGRFQGYGLCKPIDQSDGRSPGRSNDQGRR